MSLLSLLSSLSQDDFSMNSTNSINSTNSKEMGFIKNFVLWRYERGTWQYDVFCLIIIAFIFLTPKVWFEKREKLTTQTARLIVKAEDFSTDKSVMDKRVKEFSGNPNAEIVGWNEKKNARGETIYEIDIR